MKVYRAIPPRLQRITVLSAVLSLHAIFLILVLRQYGRAMPSPEPTTIAMVNIDAEQPAASKPPPPALPAEISNTFKPIMEVSIPVEANTQSDAPVGASASCSTIIAVRDGLVLDPTTLTALHAAPPDTRSIAGAVMLWNEGWIPAALTPEDPLWTVRANVEGTLAKMPEQCLDEEIIGPRLLPIPESNGNNLFVVLGSGRWMWRQMISPPTLLELDNAALTHEQMERP